MRKKAEFAHDMKKFGYDAREKRFNAHGKLHGMEVPSVKTM